ncbi:MULTISPECIES: hypothetical protein [unclassified Snodgrassella]|nr:MULTISPECIES: hypothetical protein [unclassified Snodgrassella]
MGMSVHIYREADSFELLMRTDTESVISNCTQEKQTKKVGEII